MQSWRSWKGTRMSKWSFGRSSNKRSTSWKHDAGRREYQSSYTRVIIVIREMRILVSLQAVVLGYLLVRLVQEGSVWMACSTLLVLWSSLIAFGLLHSTLKRKTDSGGTDKQTQYK